MSKLKPCPFCGGEPRIRHGKYSTGGGDVIRTVCVYCDNCGCNTEYSYHGEDKIKLWNTRKGGE